MKRRDILVAGGALMLAAPFLASAAPCPPPTLNLEGSTANTGCGTGALADWNTRIGGPGVVWYHSFDTASELAAFRTTNNPAIGQYVNDPNGSYASTSLMSWQASGGADGGGYMRITRNAGTSESPFWIRPFNPLTGASNGKGVSDPGASGSLAAQSWITTQGQDTTGRWTLANARAGYYGAATYQSANPTKFDGNDFYLQIRVKTDPRRTSSGNTTAGKKIWFTTTTSSNPPQEIVTYQCMPLGPYGTASSGQATSTRGAGALNFHNMYINNGAQVGGSTAIQLGSQLSGTCDPYNQINSGCWAYATDGTWDTLLYHITPAAAGSPTSRLEVWAAHAGQTSYTKIWDYSLSMPYDTTPNSVGAPQYAGWNALYLTTYNNGFTGVSTLEFWEAFDQVIFSKSFIPCPQA